MKPFKKFATYYGVMELSLHRRKFRPHRLLLLILLLVMFFNVKNIGRLVFPVPCWDLVLTESTAAGLEGALVAAIIKTESNFNPGARSAKGALGLMQVMPETGRWVAEEYAMKGYSPELLYDPEVNVRIGVRYAADLYTRFNGDTVQVLAAYNAGRGNVSKWLDSGDWNGKRETIDRIPYAETRQFIRKVMWYRDVYRYLYDG